MRTAIALSFLVLLTVSCARTSGQPLRAEGIPTAALFYVERHEKDERDLATDIAGALTSRGFQASAGSSAERPERVDFVVTYVDKWYWDMRMYLIDLRIDVRKPADNSIVAYGQSYQDSMAAMGKTHRDIIERALNEVFPSGG